MESFLLIVCGLSSFSPKPVLLSLVNVWRKRIRMRIHTHTRTYIFYTLELKLLFPKIHDLHVNHHYMQCEGQISSIYLKFTPFGSCFLSMRLVFYRLFCTIDIVHDTHIHTNMYLWPRLLAALFGFIISPNECIGSVG